MIPYVTWGQAAVRLVADCYTQFFLFSDWQVSVKADGEDLQYDADSASSTEKRPVENGSEQRTSPSSTESSCSHSSSVSPPELVQHATTTSVLLNTFHCFTYQLPYSIRPLLLDPEGDWSKTYGRMLTTM